MGTGRRVPIISWKGSYFIVEHFGSDSLEAADNISYSVPRCLWLTVSYLITLHKPEQQVASNVAHLTEMATEMRYAGLAIVNWKSVIGLFCRVFFFVFCPSLPSVQVLEKLTRTQKHSVDRIDPHWPTQVESGDLCFCLNVFYHWPLVNFATDCTVSS